MANNETYTCSPSEICLSDSDSELLTPTSWSDESKNEKREKRTDVMKDTVSLKNMCEKEVPLNNNIGKQIGDFVDMPSEAVELSKTTCLLNLVPIKKVTKTLSYGMGRLPLSLN
ncbi:hypothetical protein Tco_1311735 [Tanacetum coccineum]